MVQYDDQNHSLSTRILGVRLASVICLFLAAVMLLSTFINLLSYWAYLNGQINSSVYPQWYVKFEKIDNSFISFLGISLYNILLWIGVVFSSIWLLRYYQKALDMLRTLLSVDIILTVLFLLYCALTQSFKTNHPGWIITLNFLEIMVIIILSYPSMREAIEKMALYQKRNR